MVQMEISVPVMVFCMYVPSHVAYIIKRHKINDKTYLSTD